jgi:threonine aldolase
VAVSFSKGLGAPGGSMLAGNRDLMPAVIRQRRMSGGAMRQVGIFAAAADYALDHNLDRLAEDHANATIIAEALGVSAATNIVMVNLPADGEDAASFVSRARDAGVLVNALGVRRVRVVTHLDVTADQCRRAADILATLLHP